VPVKENLHQPFPTFVDVLLDIKDNPVVVFEMIAPVTRSTAIPNWSYTPVVKITPTLRYLLSAAFA